MITIPEDVEAALREPQNTAALDEYLIENMFVALRDAGLLGKTATPAQLLDAIDAAFDAYTGGLKEPQARIFRKRRMLRCAQAIINRLVTDPADIDTMGGLLVNRDLNSAQ